MKPSDEPITDDPAESPEPAKPTEEKPAEEPVDAAAPPQIAEEKPPEKPAATDDEPTWKKRLKTASLVLGVLIAILGLAGSVLDLPKKWKDFRTTVQSETGSKGDEATETRPLTGRLVDAATGAPLADVTIQLPELGEEATTDTMGVFRFELEVGAEAQVLVVGRLEGYERLERLTSVGPHQDVFPVRALEPAADD